MQRVTDKSSYRPEKAFLDLGGDFHDVVAPAAFPAHRLRYRNQRAAAEVGLEGLTDAAWVGHFGRFEPLPGSLPLALALRYHGHQFRTYNPELGDGRGFLFAQLRDGAGRLMDLGTKGSGRTPWSRFGDGRLTLKGAVREILATEMLEALGVTTSRTFSVIETGEALERGDEPSPTRSAVLVRLSHSHVRYGSFQRLAALQMPEAMTRLVDYALREIARTEPGPDPVATLMAYAVEGAARMVAQWHVAGFVHGVLNTDNMNISGESFDYGPWRFLPAWDSGFTAAYFDQFGLYAFGRQAEAVHWNLVELAKALRLIAPADSLVPALQRWPELMGAAVRRQAMWRLGLKRADAAAEEALVRALEVGMGESGIQPDAAWFAFRGGRVPDGLHPAFAALADLLPGFEPAPGALDHPYWADRGPETMLIDEVEALWAPIAGGDDWSRLDRKIEAVRRMGSALADVGDD
ncbi:protein adenylyltransferase SelO family protein [Sandaracinobacter sp.]|uniref:protein adenylyltransferase SelO family protein n=1 Tax=Sandaracinobacter sp. TaxID=2487581 RepID=UPI0035AFF735